MQRLELTIHVLNHACVRIDSGPVRLLCDPWLEGTAFSGGWGLKYDNPGALELATAATHLWISHWHSDHFSVPSLRAIASRRPDLSVLANDSANFSMAERLRELGFRDVRLLGEREPFLLPGLQRAIRYPTAGIDNMLVIEGPFGRVLNYNDCNLPARALQALARRIGPVDVLLNNYNHAGKLFHPLPVDAQKAELWRVFRAVDRIVAPRFVIPFASSHYYRTTASAAQNASLLEFDELEVRSQGDPRLVVLRPGDAAGFDAEGVHVQPRDPPLPRVPEERHGYGASVPFADLVAAADRRCRSLRARFPGAVALVAPLVVALTDLGLNLELSMRHGARAARDDATPAVRAHSRAILDWLQRRFGDDTFVAGAHFELIGEDPAGMTRWALLTLLDASHLAPVDLVGYLRSGAGRRFLWSRREEVLATLIGWRFRAGQMRL